MDSVKHGQDSDINGQALNEGSELDRIDPQHLRGAMANCFAKLNDSMQQAVKLAYIEGFSREEIADKLEIDVGAVKALLRSGAQRLGECLAAEGEAL